MDARTQREAVEILREIMALEGHAGGTVEGEVARYKAVRDLEPRVAKLRDKAELERQLAALGTVSDVAVQDPRDPYRGKTLADALLAGGFDRKSHPAVVIPNPAIGTKAGSVSGNVEDTVPGRFIAADLGLDQRYLFPRLRTVTVDGDATSVQSYRQLSRTLGTPANMIRDIDSTVAKEETDTVSEPFSADLKMIATISSGTPNILLASQNFRSWVNADLLAAYRNAIDTHIVSEIDLATIGMGGGGANAYEDVLYSQEVVRAAGYAPDLVVVSPADALAIQLLVMADGDHYAFSQQLPSFVVTTAVADGAGFVADSSALGTLFLGPFAFAAFEENAGSTNTSTVRAESSGRFVVQRADAVASLSGGS